MSCAEPSGDQHLADVAGELKRRGARLVGVGGPMMAAAGVELLADAVSESKMGLAALGRAREARRWLRALGERYPVDKPITHICCDSWAVNRYFAAGAKKRGVRVVWYAAPQAWASRPGRAKVLAELADEVACVLPFAAEWFRHRGVNARFVGHPLLSPRRGLPDHLPPANHDEPPTLALLTGSRRGVAQSNGQRMKAALDVIRAKVPGVKFVCPTTGATHELVQQMFAGQNDVTAQIDAFDKLVPQCRAAWCVSGTATLHTALHGVPMIIVYAGSPMLWHGLGRWLIQTRTFGLVNLLTSGFDPADHTCREFVPWHGDPRPAADAVADLLLNETARQRQRQAFARLYGDLGDHDAAATVAEMALRTSSLASGGASA
jgi:lipid-A-disaccharide synthase